MKTLKQLNEAAERIALMEEIDAINDTGYLTEDIVTVIETHRKAQWSEAMDVDEFSAHLDKLVEDAKHGR